MYRRTGVECPRNKLGLLPGKIYSVTLLSRDDIFSPVFMQANLLNDREKGRSGLLDCVVLTHMCVFWSTLHISVAGKQSSTTTIYVQAKLKIALLTTTTFVINCKNVIRRGKFPQASPGVLIHIMILYQHQLLEELK